MIFGMLHNTKTDRWHPIAFCMAPMPSGADDELGAWRHKSFGHHTEGFDTEADAKSDIDKTCESGEHQSSGFGWSWDGEDIPAMVEWFPKSLIQRRAT